MFGLVNDIDEVDHVNNCVVVTDLDDWFSSIQGFTCLHINIRSVRKNWIELEALLHGYLGIFDILLLSEVSVSNDCDVTSFFSIEGYNLFSNLRCGRSGGGLFLYVKNSIHVIDSKNEFNSFEGIECMLTIENNVQIKLLAIYRPPNLSQRQFISEIEMIISKSAIRNFVVVGDVNIDLLKGDDTIAQSYENVLACHGFYKCITEATREEMRGGMVTKTCIDHIFVRSNAKLINSAIATVKLSDHYMVLSDIIFNDLSNSTGESPNETCVKIREDVLLRELTSFDWNSLLKIEDGNELYAKIVEAFELCYDAATFTRKVSGRKPRVQKSWINKDIKNKLKERDKLFRKWKNCKNSLRQIYEIEYKKYRNNLRKIIGQTKNTFYQEEFNNAKNDVKLTWQKINVVMGKRKQQTVDEVLKNYLGKKYSSNHIVNQFSDSFVNDVTRMQHDCEIKTFIQNALPRIELQSMRMPHVTGHDIYSIISEMNSNKSPGWDRIRVKDLKNVVDLVSPVIAKLINISLDTGVIPGHLKISIVKPVYKKGDHLLFSNYRPIVSLPSIEKSMERCVANCLICYLKDYHIINENQYGFQKGRSTADILVKFSDFIHENLNENKHVIALFIDFSKAFDTLNHSKLILALSKIGIRGPLLNWFKDYLHGRKFRVQMGECFSPLMSSDTGVPQGSILGPILYLIYVNEMFGCVTKCRMYMYADDTVLVASHVNLENARETMQSEFLNVLRWTHDNNLIINSTKTKLMHICSPLNKLRSETINIISHSNACLHGSSQWTCNCIDKIENVDCHIYLGVHIDRFFTWQSHINSVCKRLRSVAFILYQIKYYLPLHLRRIVYFALVESIMSYGLLAWGNASQSRLNGIRSIQDKILKSIAPPKLVAVCDNINELYVDRNVLPFSKLFQFRLIIKYFFDENFKLKHSNVAKNASLRNKNKFIIPAFRNKHGKRVLNYLVPYVFNTLPSSLTCLKKYCSIKTKVKEFLLQDLLPET